MRYLFFDESAIQIIISKNCFQSTEYLEGKLLVQFLKGEKKSQLYEDIYIDIQEEGVIFSGIRNSGSNKTKIFCLDTKKCDLYGLTNDDTELLMVFQKMFRTAIKVWNKSPFSSAERISGTKIILFPFAFPDSRRIVIERAIEINQLQKWGIEFPLLAYNFCKEEPHKQDEVDKSVIKKAAHIYNDEKYRIQNIIQESKKSKSDDKYKNKAMGVINTKSVDKNEGFEYWPYDFQYYNLTEPQKMIVDSRNLSSPIRISGAAGTGKTISMLLRAYRLLNDAKENNREFKIIFLCHSDSTYKQNLAIFNNFSRSQEYINSMGNQSIKFKTLMSLTSEITGINPVMMLDYDACDAKSYQLMLIEKVLEEAYTDYTVETYKRFLSQSIKKLFLDEKKESRMYLCSILQHEFSVQIKGRTDGTFEQYKELKSIENGLKCENEKDKEFIYRLYVMYDRELRSLNNFDVDDIVLEA